MPKHADYLSVACVSDIHLGHKRTPTYHIVENLNIYLTCDKVFKDLDILFLAGDVFDDIVSMSRLDSNIILAWIHDLVLLSIKYGVCVRILEGTPSHDRSQSKHFITKRDDIHRSSGVLADVAYIDTLSVEQMTHLGQNLHVLYVPDELGAASQTLEEVDELLSSRGIDRFDVAVMHGTFDFQNPIIAHHSGTHKSAEYLKRCGLVFIGHEHTPRHLEHIHAQGSFDRLEHAQEHPKGYLRAKIYRDGSYRVSSVHNKNAMVYKTLRCHGSDMEQEYRKIDECAKSLVDGSHICIQTSKASALAQSLSVFEKRHPTLHWKIALKDAGEKEGESSSLPAVVSGSAVIINSHTLLDLVVKYAQDMNLTEERIDRIASVVSEAM